jgi:hypothetical protein
MTNCRLPNQPQGNEKMNHLLLAELQRHTAYPSVTLLLNTKPGSAMASDDRVALDGLADFADRRLAGDVLDDTRRRVITSLRGLIETSAHEPSTRSVAVFASPSHSAVVRLGEPVRDRVVVDNTFATRDLVADAQRTALFRVITVSERVSRLLVGDRSRLVEEKNDRWPLHRGENQPPRTWARSIVAAVTAEGSSHPVPTVVAGTQRVARDITNTPGFETVGVVRGNHDLTGWVALHTEAWPLVCDWLRSGDTNSLDRLQAARSSRRYAGGIDEVWDLANDGRVELLVVERSYEYPARLRDGHLVAAADVESPDVIDDAVDELIELVLQRSGRTVIVDDDVLADHDRVAAVLRY